MLEKLNSKYHTLVHLYNHGILTRSDYTPHAQIIPHQIQGGV